MSKRASFSNAKNPHDHSDKWCVCGGHNQRNRNRSKRKPARETIRKRSAGAP